mgnify:CR=1 FL=1
MIDDELNQVQIGSVGTVASLMVPCTMSLLFSTTYINICPMIQDLLRKENLISMHEWVP